MAHLIHDRPCFSFVYSNTRFALADSAASLEYLHLVYLIPEGVHTDHQGVIKTTMRMTPP